MGRKKFFSREICSSFTCKLCNYSNKSRKALDLHTKYSHGIEKGEISTTYKCVNCKIVFKTNFQLLSHTRNFH